LERRRGFRKLMGVREEKLFERRLLFLIGGMLCFYWLDLQMRAFPP